MKLISTFIGSTKSNKCFKGQKSLKTQDVLKYVPIIVQYCLCVFSHWKRSCGYLPTSVPSTIRCLSQFNGFLKWQLFHNVFFQDPWCVHLLYYMLSLVKSCLGGCKPPTMQHVGLFFQMRWRRLGYVEQRCWTKEVGDIGDRQEREIKKTAKDLWMSQKTAWRLLIGQ